MNLHDLFDREKMREAAADLIADGIPDDEAADALAERLDEWMRFEWLVAATSAGGPVGTVAGLTAATILEAIDGPIARWTCRQAVRWARRHHVERATPPTPTLVRARAILARRAMSGFRAPPVSPAVEPPDAP